LCSNRQSRESRSGGRLPTEAEWEYAAAGNENRLYPWGSTTPDATRASYYLGGNTISPVGSHPAGQGPFGHFDLAGNLWERVLDYGVSDDTTETQYNQACGDCADLTEAPLRMIRGGAYNTIGDELRATRRFALAPEDRLGWVGVRCARDP
jgi:formylglycine-generating enzyme